LLERVGKGERIVITKHGKPVAMLVPPAEKGKMDPEELIQRFRRQAKGKTLGALTPRELIEEGRRF
jgi:prevent-host-death family protein